MSQASLSVTLRNLWDQACANGEVTKKELQEIVFSPNLTTDGKISSNFRPDVEDDARAILIEAKNNLHKLLQTNSGQKLYAQTQALFAMITLRCRDYKSFSRLEEADACAAARNTVWEVQHYYTETVTENGNVVEAVVKRDPPVD